MNVFELTRALVDIESITNNEERVGNYLYDYLAPLAARYGGKLERIEVEPRRSNLFAQWGDRLAVTLSTHLDTVPPFIASREDDEHIWGRGSCDTKGIIAAMIKAVEALLEAGERNFGLLFVVGEERNSAGAYKAGRMPRGSRYIVNGEPTENKLALGSKGALRYEVVANGKMAHSAYPELGDSAIHKLIDALSAIREIPLPTDSLLGASTLNIGTLAGGRAPNVIADEARADIMIRLVGDSTGIKQALARAVEGRAELREVIEIPALRLNAVEGIPTTVVAFTTDIPAFAGQWGEPLLIGPGSIHVAHTLEERVPKRQLLEAVEIYQRIVRQLCKRVSK
ncbi:MAG TPA: M20/M25/M40 family metallo-hydrolase [Candidatus Sulfopaludibacter sp.]|nr:M20/M25/M40 family metallo-hydrolase [Candidatus Sulfopaludibacter sp.]